MISVSEIVKTAYKTDNTRKEITIYFPESNITLTNDNIVADSLKLSQSIEKNRYLSFTGCNASEFEFKCEDPLMDVRGQKVIVSISAAGTDSITLFTGYVNSQDNRTHEDVLTTIRAYDILNLKMDTDITEWYQSQTFPVSIKQFREALVNYVGIQEDTSSLINDNLTLEKTIEEDTKITFGSLLRWICQLNASFGQINGEGKLVYRHLHPISKGLYPALTLYPSANLFPMRGSDEDYRTNLDRAIFQSLNYEPYNTALIRGVQIFGNDGTVQGAAGSGNNLLNIADNPLAYGVDMQTAASNIFNEVDGVWFNPAQIKLVGLPYMECGDIVYANTNKHECQTYILSRTLQGIQAMFDSYSSEADEYLAQYKETLQTKTTRNTKEINQCKADIVEANELIAQRATIEQLEASNARIGTLEADHVSVNDLNAATARIGSLEADHVTVTDFNAVSAKVDTINANYISTGNLSSQIASLNNVTMARATIQGQLTVGGKSFAIYPMSSAMSKPSNLSILVAVDGGE